MRLPITEYGRKDLAIATIATAVLVAAFVWIARGWPAAWVLAGLLVVVWLLLVNFFRDPEREIPAGEFLIRSPADGVVQDLAEIDEPRFLQSRATRLGIFLSPIDVHVNRMPLDAKVVQVIHTRGRMLRAYDPLAITENESAAVCLEVLGGRAKMVVRQVTGAVARRIVCPVQPGDVLRAGQRYGMIKLGSRTEVIVPASVTVRWHVAIGDRVKGGSTILGTILPEGSA